MAKGNQRTYRVAEFARLAGVSVRALRHYERLGLLTPRRTDAGYRAYTARDLESLEQIVALKFIGIPLRQIPIVRRAATGALARALTAQRDALEAKRRQLARAIDAIAEAEAILRAGRQADVALYKRIIEVIEMQNDEREWMTAYRMLIDRKAAHLKAMPVQTREELRRQWTGLIEEIHGALDQDPGGPAGQRFAARWLDLMRQVSGVEDESLRSHLAAQPPSMDARRFLETLPEADRARMAAMLERFADPRVSEFIQRALAAGQRRD